MLGSWSQKRWLVYHLIQVSVTATGASSYTIGVGGDFNTPASVRQIKSGFVRQVVPTVPNQVDYPLYVIPSREDYNRITLKGLTTLSNAVFLDAGFPLGTVYPWPVPNASTYQIHLSVTATLTAFTSLTQDIVLPPEYMEALLYNLAVRLRPAYQIADDPTNWRTIQELARNSLNVIKNTNAQIPRLQMPRALFSGGSGYNIYSDGYS